MNVTTENDIAAIAELKLRKILTSPAAPSPGSVNFRKWLLQQFVQHGQNDCDCPLEKFALYFFNAVRQHTYVHLRGAEIPKGSFVKTDDIPAQKKHMRGSLDANCRGIWTGVQLQSFPVLGTPPGRNFTHVLSRNASTPVRRSLNHPQQQQQQQQQQKQSQQTAQNSRRSVESGNKSFSTTAHTNSFEKSRNSTGDGSVGSNSFCLGDFLTSPTIGNRHSSAQKKPKVAQSNTPSTPNSSSSSSKPKKRVVPISVSKTTTPVKDSVVFGANSSFSQENNMLNLSQTEIKEFNKRAVAEARRALKNDLSEVSSVMKASTPNATPTKKPASSATDATSSMIKLDIACSSQRANIETDCSLEPIVLDKIPSQTVIQLKMLASIYGLLLDMNLTTNVLNEISFLLNLLNANAPPNEVLENVGKNDKDLVPLASAEEKTSDFENHTGLVLLKEVINSILFAICVLEDQQHTLSLIDTKSLGVVLQCERLVCLSPTLKASLSTVYAQKQSFSTMSVHDVTSGGLKNVCFQEDTDSRKFFHTNNEFGAFKTQRDLFYSALKLWEKHHLYPSWNFTIEVSPKVCEIFRMSENPINMTHFAKLFVSQLLISATEQTSPEEVGIEMDDVDLEKFNKLSQRLIAPGDFSVDYQFPREQAFFRDFIVESRSVPFIEHLKLVLFSELIALNDSTFEQVNLLAEDGYHECNEEFNEFIVSPPVLGSMLILAKFLGFVTALPFQCSIANETHSVIIQSHQIRLRKLFQPPVNVCHILEMAIANGRHLITIPWIVQYLALLDDVTLQLDNFVEAIQKLFVYYTALGNGELQITATSAFIVRCCLGWLFEQKPAIGTEYINYRATLDSTAKNSLKLQKAIVKTANATADLQLKSILDGILCVACPFLAEFRVSIMPPKHAMAKYVSRSGRFRHITPCIAAEPMRSIQQNQLQPTSTSGLILSAASNSALSAPESASKKRQKILMESFLHAQNSSMRRLIVFLSERVYKCVVRDAQCKILLPLKSAADKQANEIKSSDKKDVLEQVTAIYRNARSEAHKQWDNQVPEMLNKRTARGLEDLLPNETTPIIKKAYAWRIRSDAKIKIDQWRHMNLYRNDFYCNDINELAGKICKANSVRITNAISQTTELKLVKSQPKISDLIEELQHWLYTTGFQTSFQPEVWSIDQAHRHQEILNGRRDAALIEFLERLKSSFENTLPTIYYRLIGSGLVQLLQHLIIKTPMSITNDLIRAVCEFFSNEKIRDADIASAPIKESKIKNAMDDSECSELNALTVPTTPTIYHALITASFVQSLGTCQVRFDKLKELLCELIQSNVIAMDFVNELFVTVFKEDLNPNVMYAISKMLYDLAQKTTSTSSKVVDRGAVDDDYDSDDGLKAKLFMEMLADFSRDLDDF